MAAGVLADVEDLVGLPERLEDRLPTDGPPACSLAFNPWGTLLAAGTEGAQGGGEGGIALFDWQTRSVACYLRGGHDGRASVTALLWSADGCSLLSGATDGSVAAWDVGAGTCTLRMQLPRGGAVTHLAWAGSACRAGQEERQQQGQEQGQPGGLGEGTVLVSRAAGPALLLELRDASTQQELPLIAIAEPPPRPSASRVSANGGEGGAGPSGQVAVVSQDGEVIYAGSRGMLLALRRSDLALLDAVKIEGSPRVLALQLHPSGRRLLVTTADQHIRVYLLHRPGQRQPQRAQHRLQAAAAAAAWDGEGGAAQQQQQRQEAGGAAADAAAAPGPQGWQAKGVEEARQLAAQPGRPNNASLFYGPDQAWLTLQLTFRGDGGARGRHWGCAAFCPGGEYFAAALEAGGNVVHLFEAAVEGQQQAALETTGGDRGTVRALCWHPCPAPMQLVSVNPRGSLDVWAKAFTENWSAFAPDFKELKTNDEYIEPEDEFDANPRPEDDAATAAALQEEEELDIGVPFGQPGAPGASSARLLHLPLRLDPHPAAAVPRAAEPGAERQAGAAAGSGGAGAAGGGASAGAAGAAGSGSGHPVGSADEAATAVAAGEQGAEDGGAPRTDSNRAAAQAGPPAKRQRAG